MEISRQGRSTACPECGRRPFLAYFQFRLRFLFLALIPVSLFLAIPLRNWQNTLRFEQMKVTLQTWHEANINSDETTRFGSSGFAERTDRYHFWSEFEASTNRGQPNATKHSYEIHVTLAPFPSLAGPKIWAVDRITNRRLTQSEINEILRSTFDIEPVEY
jgi:hypothetical protein